MRVLLLGASGRTGGWLLDELTARGHQLAVVVRSPTGPHGLADRGRGHRAEPVGTGEATRRTTEGAAPAGVGVGVGLDIEIHRGDVRDLAVLAGALVSTREGRPLDAVVSALGPRPGATDLHRDLAVHLVAMMPGAGVTRFIGVSGAAVDAMGDRKSLRDRGISALMQRFGGAVVTDKQHEYEVWSVSGLDWTLVRPPRLIDAPPRARATAEDTGVPPGTEHRIEDQVEHHAHRSPRRTSISRAALARFVADELEHSRYRRAAPLIAAR